VAVASYPSNARIITFDPPGSIQTEPLSINALGAITGWYLDGNDGNHGFVRAPDGTITNIDAPKGTCGTVAWSINRKGAVTGTYLDRGVCKSSTQANQVANDIVEQAGWGDLATGEAIRNALQNGTPLTQAQQASTQKFTNQLPALDQQPLNQLLHGSGK
jgi:hypothetical protein